MFEVSFIQPSQRVLINNNGSLTVEDNKDSENKGTISGSGNGLIVVGGPSSPGGSSTGAGTFTLNSGNIKITGNQSAVQVAVNNSIVNINGGTINAQSIGINVSSYIGSKVEIKGGKIDVTGTSADDVAVKDINGNTINMMDPGSDSTDLWSEYNWANTSQLVYYKVG